ncbi:DMT family transporter [Arthrobacter rhombi]|uniref:DMT family transporter n=1 Tax=Arthrobacter rhombi TaxID=71253 RepID=UPI003FD26788
MIGWALLGAAIVSEVAGTLSLRMATSGSRRWYGAVATGYLVAFSCLALALQTGLGLGVAYGIWAAVGVALTALASKVLFGEPLNWVMTIGIILIIGGVLLVETGAAA